MAGLRQRRLMNEINVVPYIDVMLVLLVIFMVTSPMVQPGSIDLPTVGKSNLPPVAPIEVIIRSDTSLALRDRTRSNSTEQPVSKPELVAAIKQAQAKNPQQSVVIAGDKNVKYEVVLEVMDDLQRQQVTRIGLLVQPGKPAK